MKSNIIKLVLIITSFTLLISCSSKEMEYNKSNAFGEVSDEALQMESIMDIETVHEKKSESSSSITSPTPSIRKRIYNGDTHLVVESIEDIKKEIEQLTISVDGYVTHIYEKSITIKVPAAEFNNTFEKILIMGEVLSKNISTYDVTDQYADSSAQLETAIKTRQRLQKLLKQSTEPEERAKILKEIGRLTQEIELIKNRLEILNRNIEFSTITILLSPRLEQIQVKQDIPFKWIANLHPLYSVSSKLEAKLSFDPGPNFAVFSKDKIYYAQSATGTSIKISTVKNQPLGDNKFWQKALIHFMESYYKKTIQKELSFGKREILGVEFISKDSSPYRYFVGVTVIGKKIHIIEIYSPDSEDNFDQLYEKLKEGEIK